MQQDVPIEWSKIKKPDLSNKNLQIDPIEKISVSYRYRISALITAFGKPQYYLPVDKKKTVPARKRSKEDFISKISNALDISCRFISRSSYQIVRQPMVKLMEIDMRALMHENAQSQEFQEQYLDLDDQDELQKQREEEDDKILSTLVTLPEDEVRRQIQAKREKHNLNANQKIYIVQGEIFEILKEELNAHGWYENTDLFSPIYELKFCYAKKFLCDPIPEQIVSRYQNTKLLSTKYGLTRSLRHCFAVTGNDSNQFYPRCYDISDEADLEDFLEEYKFTWCLNYILKGVGSLAKAQLCLKLLQRRSASIQLKIDQILNGEYPVISQQEWMMLQQVEQQPEQFKLDIPAEYKQWDVQYKLSNGENIWVCKPTGLSRGRGIKYFRDLKEILSYVSGAKDVNFVVQKCVENIMTIDKRKFDIRQWILVSDQLWMYQECYIRFCGVEYNTNDLKNRYAHLTNFSVQKNNTEVHDNLMFTQQEFADHLQTMNFDFKTLRSKMEQIIISTIKTCQKSIQNRKNTFEVFGLDFIVDSECNPWLVEVNASPTFGQSTPVTERLVKMGLHDLSSFIVNQYTPNGIKSNKYGGWEVIK